MKSRVIGAALSAIVVCANAPARGQVNDDLYGSINFNFSPPGARSLGMGNAFAGLADDATAAYANPAGLLWLEDSEVAVEVRYRRFVTSYVDGGSYSGVPSGEGLDTEAGLRYSEFESDTTGIGYLSWAYPRERWVISLYRHESANYTGSIDGSEGSFMDVPGGTTRFRIAPLTGELDLEIVDYGLAGAWKVSSSFWLGLGISYQQFDHRGTSARFSVFELVEDSLVLDYGPADFSPERAVDHHQLSGSDGALVAKLGWLWRQDRWSLGGFFRQGGTFEFDYRAELGPSGIALAEAQGLDIELLEARLTGSTHFRLPHVWGLGGSIRPSDSWLISFEVDRIEYSRLSPSANIQISGLDLREPGYPDSEGELDLYQVDDGTELHLGFEWARLGDPLFALRLGAWYDPDHTLNYRGDTDRIRIRYLEGDATVHLTAGFGVAFREGRVQLDGAVDSSDLGTIASLSMVLTY